MNIFLLLLILGDSVLLLVVAGYRRFFDKRGQGGVNEEHTKRDLLSELGRQQIEKLQRYHISLPISTI